MKKPIKEVMEMAEKENKTTMVTETGIVLNVDNTFNAALSDHYAKEFPKLLEALEDAQEFIPSVDGTGCMACIGICLPEECCVCTKKKKVLKVIKSASTVEVSE